MRYRGSPRGEPSAVLPPAAFVSFLQNHDQVGNRAFGDRLTHTTPLAAVRAVASVYLLAPQIPMLFMGEEWGAAQPFPFFCSFEGDLADAVREGRRNEFARFPEFQDPEQRDRIPDPILGETFRSAKLVWQNSHSGKHAELLSLYRDLLRVRHAEIVPRLKGIGGYSGRYDVLDKLAVRVSWSLADRSELGLMVNLKAAPLPDIELPQGRILWSEGSAQNVGLGPWGVVWTLFDGTS